MKRIIAILLAVLFVVSLASCAGSSTNETTSEKIDSKAGETQQDAATDNNTSSSDGKTLIVYFSWSNNTETMANYIHDRIGGDMECIEPVEAYPEDYDSTAELAKSQRDNDERPAFRALQYNPEDYDTIFIGYPIWWYELPMIMRTFLDTYDLSGKTIVPFNTHEGSGDGGTYDQIKAEESNTTVLEGLPIRGGDIENADSKDKVISWLEGLGY